MSTKGICQNFVFGVNCYCLGSLFLVSNFAPKCGFLGVDRLLVVFLTLDVFAPYFLHI